MKFTPSYIIYKQSLRYLNEDDKRILIEKLQYIQRDKKVFLNTLLRNFNYNLFKDAPLIWQDV